MSSTAIETHRPPAPGSTDPELSRVRSLRERIRDVLPETDSPGGQASPDSLRKILVICSASRSGSTLLVKLLSRHPGFYGPIGESVPFLRLHALIGHGEESEDQFRYDHLTPATRRQLVRDLVDDMVVASRAASEAAQPGSWQSYLRRALLRLPLQWPSVVMDEAAVESLAHDTELAGEWRAGGPGAAYTALLHRLAAQGATTMRVERYDRGTWRANGVAGPPHGGPMLEEPPFEMVPAAPGPTERDFERGHLLLKCPTDSFRLCWIRELFRHADIRYIFLTRNPAASINGLMDGWRSDGFFSHCLRPNTLAVSGYGEICGEADRWWKFDLPPGWQAYRHADLADVCAYQWAANNDALLSDVHVTGGKVWRVTYEDLIHEQRRFHVLSGILNDLGIAPVESVLRAAPALVQATVRPVPGRWRKRAREIMRAAGESYVRDISERLEYPFGAHESWE